MKKLTIDEMVNIEGGYECGGAEAAGALSLSVLGLEGAAGILLTGSLIFAPAAIIAGGAALAIAVYCG